MQNCCSLQKYSRKMNDNYKIEKETRWKIILRCTHTFNKWNEFFASVTEDNVVVLIRKDDKIAFTSSFARNVNSVQRNTCIEVYYNIYFQR